MGTAAQAWLEQGKAEGEARGKAKGQIDLLVRQLERRFGPLPPEAVGRVRAASPEEIVAWADAVLDAPSLEAIFSKHKSF